MKSHSSEKNNSHITLGLSLGLLAACLMTLLSVYSGQEPETILIRATIGASIVTLISTVLLHIITFIFEDDDF